MRKEVNITDASSSTATNSNAIEDANLQTVILTLKHQQTAEGRRQYTSELEIATYNEAGIKDKPFEVEDCERGVEKIIYKKCYKQDFGRVTCFQGFFRERTYTCTESAIESYCSSRIKKSC